jgi:hypothetical protein
MAKSTRPKAEDPIPGVPVEARPLRLALFVLTVLTAAAALFLEPALAGAVHRGALASGWLFLPIALYGVFFLVYAVDRWLLVRRRRYPAGRAFFQVAFGLLFALLLLPSTIGDWNLRQPEGEERLLTHPDATVRKVAIEARGFRGFAPAEVPALAARLKDQDPGVRAAAALVLGRWSGKNPEDVDGIRAWATGAARTATAAAERAR